MTTAVQNPILIAAADRDEVRLDMMSARARAWIPERPNRTARCHVVQFLRGLLSLTTLTPTLGTWDPRMAGWGPALILTLTSFFCHRMPCSAQVQNTGHRWGKGGCFDRRPFMLPSGGTEAIE